MGITLIQPSMSAGELSQELFGRVDTEHYQLGLALARNFLVDYHGGISNRPGSLHVSIVESPVRHIPFERSATVTYMLEFEQNKIRILQGGEYITTDGFNLVELETPYLTEELEHIRFIQSVDVMTLFHGDHPIYQVKHFSRENWTFEEFTTKSGPYEPVNIDESKRMWATGQTGTVSLLSNFDVFEPDMVGRHVYLEASGSLFTKSWIQRMVASVGSTCYYAGNYYVCTSARSNSLTGDTPPTHTRGERWDGPDQDIPNDNDDHYIGIKWRYSNSGYGELKIIQYISPTEVIAEVTVELPKDVINAKAVATQTWTFTRELYQERFNLSPTPSTFEQGAFSMEFGVYPNFGLKPLNREGNWYVLDFWGTPQLVINEQPGWTAGDGNEASFTLKRTGAAAINQYTYKWAFDSFSDDNGYPKCGTYYSNRLCLGGSKKFSQNIWMSKDDSYNDFGSGIPLLAEDSLSINVAGVKLSEVEHLLPLNALLSFTSGSIWAVNPGESKRVLADDPPPIDAQSYRGCSHIAPLLTGNEALYVQNGGKTVREIQYDYLSNSFADINLCVRASHLFRNKKIVSWAYAPEPYHLIWVVFDDGSAATLTYMKEQRVWGWTSHETQGKYLTVSAVEETDRTAVYFSVLRDDGKIHVEYLADRNITDVKDSMFLDDGVTVDARINDTITLTGGVEWKHPEKITVTSENDSLGAISVGRELIIQFEGENYRFKVLAFDPVEKALTVRIEQVLPEGMREKPLDQWGMFEPTIYDLEHLAGMEVHAVVDGMYAGEYTVDEQGSIELDTAGLVVHIGLLYKSRAKTLPIDLQTQQLATAKNIPKAIEKVNIELYNSYGGSAGTKLGSMYDIKVRDYEDYGAPVSAMNGIAEVDVSSSYDNTAQLYIEQDKPLPFTVLSIIPKVDFGEDD